MPPRAARVARIDPADAPTIDGDVSDPVWSRVEPIGELRQREPIEDGDPTERTVVRIAQDGSTVYFALECYDGDPAAIRATQRRRDADLDPDDRIEIVIDPQHDRRNGYFFAIGPAGSYGDALIAGNGRSYNKSWDGLWFGRARITQSGWFAEIAIPVRTLAVSESVTTWGFNLERFIRRKREELIWASPSQNSGIERIADAGDLTGLDGLQQGIGLDLVPYVKLSANHDQAAQDGDLLGTAGGELFYRLTPGLTGAFTLNTDFAETEVDERIVNLTRFPLFLPEKRKFFLEDAGVFTFDVGGEDSTDLLPFFSRRIGLDDEGQEIPIETGAKVSGYEGPWSLGVLAVRTGAQADVDARDLFVARVRRNLDEHQTLGGIVTAGNPTAAASNAVAGADYRYSTSTFLGDRNLDVTLFGLESRSGADAGGDAASDSAFGGEVSYPNDLVTARLRARQIGEDFEPALGFVERTGIREYDGELSWEPRPHTGIRQVFLSWKPDYIEDLSGRLATSTQRFGAGLELESGDEGRVFVEPQVDRVDESFEIVPGITVPADRYDQTRYGIVLESAGKRPLVAALEVETGHFDGGERTDVSTELDWRPGGMFNLGLGYEQNDLDLPDGAFTVRVASVRTEVNWSPALSWQNLLQYDNVSEEIGWNSRVRWTLEPGDDAWFVLGQSWKHMEHDVIVPERTEFTVKFVRTIRF